MFKLSEEEKASIIMLMISCLFILICTYYDKGTITYKNITSSIIIILVTILIGIIHIYTGRKCDK